MKYRTINTNSNEKEGKKDIKTLPTITANYLDTKQFTEGKIMSLNHRLVTPGLSHDITTILHRKKVVTILNNLAQFLMILTRCCYKFSTTCCELVDNLYEAVLTQLTLMPSPCAR